MIQGWCKLIMCTPISQNEIRAFGGFCQIHSRHMLTSDFNFALFLFGTILCFLDFSGDLEAKKENWNFMLLSMAVGQELYQLAAVPVWAQTLRGAAPGSPAIKPTIIPTMVVPASSLPALKVQRHISVCNTQWLPHPFIVLPDLLLGFCQIPKNLFDSVLAALHSLTCTLVLASWMSSPDTVFEIVNYDQNVKADSLSLACPVM